MPARRPAGQARERVSVVKGGAKRRARVSRLALGLATFSALATMLAAPAAAETLLMRNFTLIDGTGAPAKPQSAMIVTDGRIIWVGAAGDARAPEGAQIVDLSGKYVMPGIIDLHIHLGNLHELTQDQKYYTRDNVEKDLRTYASYGVTTVQIMGTDKDVIFDIRREQRAGRPAMARVYTAGQGLVLKGGYGGVPGVNHPVATPAEAAAEVDAQATKGADFIKLWVDDELHTMPEMAADMSKAIIDAAHRHGLKAYAHVFYLDDAKRLTAQGVDGFVHTVRDQPVDQALIDAMKAMGTVQIASTLSREAAVMAFGQPAPELKDPFFQQSISPTALAMLASPERQKTIAAQPSYPRLPAFLAAAESNTRKMFDAGVVIGFGTDAGPPGRVPGYSEHWELAELVKVGLTPAQAIHAATAQAAELLGTRDLGTITRGRWADLIVLDADPTANILNSRRINAVYIAGRPVPTVK